MDLDLPELVDDADTERRPSSKRSRKDTKGNVAGQCNTAVQLNNDVTRLDSTVVNSICEAPCYSDKTKQDKQKRISRLLVLVVASPSLTAANADAAPGGTIN